MDALDRGTLGQASFLSNIKLKLTHRVVHNLIMEMWNDR